MAKELGGKYTKKVARKNTLQRQAFLDDILEEATDPAYEFPSIDAAVDHLSRKYSLSYEELKYLKTHAAKAGIPIKKKGV